MPSAAFTKALEKINKDIPKIIADPRSISKKIILDSPRLNYVYGGAFTLGRIHRLIGPESGGKSTMCIYLASQIQKHCPGHGICIYIDFERSFDVEHAKENGLDVSADNFVYMKPDSLEDADLAIEELIKTDEIGSIILDSESMGVTRTIITDELGKANFGSYAKTLKDFLNRMNILCSNHDTTLFIISQERAQMQMMSHAIQTTGGYALKYAASTMNRVKKIESLKEGSKEVGIHMNVRNYKNKTGIPWRECDMDLYFKGGFDSTCEYVDFIKDLCADSRLAPLCTAGAGGTFKSEKFQFSIRGRDNMIDWAKKDHPGWEEIKKVINEIISGNNNMDENRVNPDEDDNVSDEMKEVLKADKEAEEEHQPTTLEEVPIAKSKKKKADLDDTAGEPLATTEDIPDIKMND